MMERQRDERSLGELFSELSRETSALVREEIELAKTELSEKAAMAGKHAGYIAAGGAIAYAGFLAIVAAVGLLLARVIPDWLSALIVGIVVAGGGYYLVQRGISALKNADLKPRATVETLKGDRKWIKNQVK
jgi:threonine/homoserine/homoserine lactone efflux protein